MLTNQPLDLRRVPELRGSRRTLFLYDSQRDEWWLCAWDGAEIRIDRKELEEFVVHCLRHGRGGDPCEAQPEPPERRA